MTIKFNEGGFCAEGLKFAIVVARFNEFITKKLVNGAVDALLRHGCKETSIEVFWVPGAFEIPVAAQKVASSNQFDAIICVGAVIRGATPHFEYVSSEVSKGIAKISLDFGMPITFGVLTTDNIQQATQRAGANEGNKGFEAAMAAIEMSNLIRSIKTT